MTGNGSGRVGNAAVGRVTLPNAELRRLCGLRLASFTVSGMGCFLRHWSRTQRKTLTWYYTSVTIGPMPG